MLIDARSPPTAQPRRKPLPVLCENHLVAFHRTAHIHLICSVLIVLRAAPVTCFQDLEQEGWDHREAASCPWLVVLEYCTKARGSLQISCRQDRIQTWELCTTYHIIISVTSPWQIFRITSIKSSFDLRAWSNENLLVYRLLKIFLFEIWESNLFDFLLYKKDSVEKQRAK